MTAREELPFETLIWSGITIHIRYEARYLGLADLSHLDIEAVSPERAKLPITETGYRSHFFNGSETVAEYGGPLGYVRAWLDAEAATPEWQSQVAASRQLDLF